MTAPAQRWAPAHPVRPMSCPCLVRIDRISWAFSLVVSQGYSYVRVRVLGLVLVLGLGKLQLSKPRL